MQDGIDDIVQYSCLASTAKNEFTCEWVLCIRESHQPHDEFDHFPGSEIAPILRKRSLANGVEL